MRHYMHMIAYFDKIVKSFLVLDQIVEDENTIMDLRYDVSNLPLPLIDQNEEELNNIDILKEPIENRTREWIYAQIAKLKLQGATLTYSELKDELKSEISNGTTTIPTEEALKSPLAT